MGLRLEIGVDKTEYEVFERGEGTEGLCRFQRMVDVEKY